MVFTEEEGAPFNGDKGTAVQKATQILVALSKSFGADRLLPINNVHMACSSVLVAEEGGTRFVEDIRKQGGDFVTRVTTNPTAVDPTRWKEIGIPESDSVLQIRLTDAHSCFHRAARVHAAAACAGVAGHSHLSGRAVNS